MLTQSEWDIIQELLQFLQVFKKATEMLSSEDATANKILVLRSNLEIHLDEKSSDSRLVKELKNNMRSSFAKR